MSHRPNTPNSWATPGRTQRRMQPAQGIDSWTADELRAPQLQVRHGPQRIHAGLYPQRPLHDHAPNEDRGAGDEERPEDDDEQAVACETHPSPDDDVASPRAAIASCGTPGKSGQRPHKRRVAAGPRVLWQTNGDSWTVAARWKSGAVAVSRAAATPCDVAAPHEAGDLWGSMGAAYRGDCMGCGDARGDTVALGYGDINRCSEVQQPRRIHGLPPLHHAVRRAATPSTVATAAACPMIVCRSGYAGSPALQACACGAHVHLPVFQYQYGGGGRPVSRSRGCCTSLQTDRTSHNLNSQGMHKPCTRSYRREAKPSAGGWPGASA